MYKELEQKSKWVRQQVLEMVYRSGHGHLGGSFSCVEILIALYYAVMQPEDIFILSKGHACSTLYAILADRGFFPIKELEMFCRRGSRLQGHPTKGVPGIVVSTGSLGNGLGIGAGLALAKKIKGEVGTIFVLIGDGEFDEGSNWEAMRFISEQDLRITVIIDANSLSCTRRIARDAWNDVLYGFPLFHINGHDIDGLVKLLSIPIRRKAIIAETIKGKGISFMEDKLEWHNKIPNPHEYEMARGELL